MNITNGMAIAIQIVAAAKARLAAAHAKRAEMPEERRIPAQAFSPGFLDGRILSTDDGGGDVGMLFNLYLEGADEARKVQAVVICTDSPHRYRLGSVEFGGVRFQMPPNTFIDDLPEHAQAATA